jgi:hypothetical protein
LTLYSTPIDPVLLSVALALQARRPKVTFVGIDAARINP